MGETSTPSPHVKKLKLMYMAADNVNVPADKTKEQLGDTGHIELILGPHSIEELKDGLTAQKVGKLCSKSCCAECACASCVDPVPAVRMPMP